MTATPWTLRSDLELFGIKLPEKFSLEDCALSLRNDPAQSTLVITGLAALLFYLIERGKNPKVNDICDSLVYCTTCLSVGYGDIFAKTPLGKLIGSALMTIGPALSGAALDGSRAKTPDREQEILDTLRQILDHLQKAAG